MASTRILMDEHRVIERVLTSLEATGVARQGGPIGAMLWEHEEGRRLNRAMRSAAFSLDAGQSNQAATVAQHALAYGTLLRQHIATEDGVLLPLADRVIGPAQRPGLTAAFDRIEHEVTGAGVHERYLTMADRLEAAARR